jgi:hypothetical protein
MSRLEYAGRQNVAVDKRNPFMRILLGAFHPVTHQRDTRLAISVDVPALAEQIQSVSSPKWQMAGMPHALESKFEDIQFTELAKLEKRLALTQEGGHVTSFFRRFPEPSKLIPVTKKPEWENSTLEWGSASSSVSRSRVPET